MSTTTKLRISRKQLQTDTWFKKLKPKYKNFYNFLFTHSAGNGYISANKEYADFLDDNKCRIHGLINACNKDGVQRIVQVRQGAWWIKHKYFHTFGFRYLPQVSAHRGAVGQLIANNITYTDLCAAGLLNEQEITVETIKEDARKNPRKPSAGKKKSKSKAANSAEIALMTETLAELDQAVTPTVVASNTESSLTLSNANDANAAAAKGTVELLGDKPDQSAHLSAPVTYRTNVPGLSENIAAFLSDPQYFIDFASDKNNQIKDLQHLREVVQSFVNLLFNRRQPRPLDEIYVYFTNWRAKQVKDMRNAKPSNPFVLVKNAVAIYELSYSNARQRKLPAPLIKELIMNTCRTMNESGHRKNKFIDISVKEIRQRRNKSR